MFVGDSTLVVTLYVDCVVVISDVDEDDLTKFVSEDVFFFVLGVQINVIIPVYKL